MFEHSCYFALKYCAIVQIIIILVSERKYLPENQESLYLQLDILKYIV